jgi:hypothetical protein
MQIESLGKQENVQRGNDRGLATFHRLLYNREVYVSAGVTFAPQLCMCLRKSLIQYIFQLRLDSTVELQPGDFHPNFHRETHRFSHSFGREIHGLTEKLTVILR